MSKATVGQEIRKIKSLADVIGPVETFHVDSNKIEIYVVEKGPLFDNFIVKKQLSNWVIDDKGNEHLVLMVKDYYVDHQEMYDDELIAANFYVHQLGKKYQNKSKIITIIMGTILVLGIILVGVFQVFNVWLAILAGISLYIGISFLIGYVFNKMANKQRLAKLESVYQNNPKTKELMEKEPTYISDYIASYFKNLDEQYLVIEKERQKQALIAEVAEELIDELSNSDSTSENT